MDLPLGLKEDFHLEFKASAALREPANIVREIVAFMNADGGSLWVGIAEKDGVASSIEAVSNVEQECARLQNAIVDLIEPSPAVGKEVAIHVVALPAAPDSGLLHIEIRKGHHGPYALRRQSGRAFLRRTGSRLREMTRDEIATAFSGAPQQEVRATEKIRRSIDERMRKWADQGSFAGLKLIVEPAGEVNLALTRAALEPILRNPQLSGNRPLGWNFASNYAEPKPRPHGWQFGEVGKVQWLSISEKGAIEFSAVLERLHWKGEPNELWPFALIELPVSVVRLARTLMADFASPPVDPGLRIVLALGLFQIGECTLAPFSPAAFGYQMARPKKFMDISQQSFFFSDPPVEVPWKELAASPDRSVYPLVRQLYRAFEYEENQIPAEYSADSRELRFPA